jgi:hypothetical protein
METTRLQGQGPDGRLPLSEEMLRSEPSGNLFGLTQNAGMGWHPAEVARPNISSSAPRAVCETATAVPWR